MTIPVRITVAMTIAVAMAIAVGMPVPVAMAVSIGDSVPGSNAEINLWTRGFELQIDRRALLA